MGSATSVIANIVYLKKTLKKWVLSWRLKDARESHWRSSAGSEFHRGRGTDSKCALTSLADSSSDDEFHGGAVWSQGTAVVLLKQVSQINWRGICVKNAEHNWQQFILCAEVYWEPVKMFQNGCNACPPRNTAHKTGCRVLRNSEPAQGTLRQTNKQGVGLV